MPRKSSTASLAEQHRAPAGVLAVDRALSVLAAFAMDRPALRLVDIAASTGLHKSTVLRMLASLEHAQLVQRQNDASYVLGPGIPRLQRVYSASFSLGSVVVPVLRELVAVTDESAAFHVRHGEQRSCLYRVDSPRPVRDHLKVGDVLPMDRGAGGQVLSAYSGVRGKIYDRIRATQLVVLAGDRVAEIAGIAAPVFQADGELAGALVLSMPSERLNPDHAGFVRAAARRITKNIGGEYPAEA